MKILLSQAATAYALYNEVTFNGHINDAERLKSELFNDKGIFIINELRREIVSGQLDETLLNTLDRVCDKCAEREPTLSEVQHFLLFPDLTGDQGGFSQTKLDVYMTNVCSAVNCRDRVPYCGHMISEGTSCETDWMATNCPNSCGCPMAKACPPHITEEVEEVIEAVLDDAQAEDDEHSDELMNMSITDALDLLDPSEIFGQFSADVRATLQTQMCAVPNVDTRIVAANDFLRILADPETARKMNYISQKLPMYLTGLPQSTKELLANEVICGGYTRSVTAESCLGTMLSDDRLVCDAREERWTFDRTVGTCVKALYDGCFETNNRFFSKAACENKCSTHIKAIMKVNERKLENFISMLKPENVRASLLQMFGKQPNATYSMEVLLNEACNPTSGKVNKLYRERVCERLYQLHDANKAKGTTPAPTTKLEGSNPVVKVEQVCPATTEERKFCTKRPAGRFAQWQAACEKAGCCFDRTPPGSRGSLLWKDFCFQKIEKRTVVVVPATQVDETDQEHTSDNGKLNCNVAIGARTFCTDKTGKTVKSIRQNCESAGCCFDSNNGKFFPKWKQTCFQPGN